MHGLSQSEASPVLSEGHSLFCHHFGTWQCISSSFCNSVSLLRFYVKVCLCFIKDSDYVVIDYPSCIIRNYPILVVVGNYPVVV